MTIYQCSTCSSFHSSEEPPCPQVFTFAVESAPVPRIRICDRCGDTALADDGSCQVCSQQIMYSSAGGPPFRLSIIRGGTWRIRSQSGRAAGPSGKHLTCAVVAQSDVGNYGEYLTACGDVVRRNQHSVWSSAPTCPACRRELRKGGAS